MILTDLLNKYSELGWSLTKLSKEDKKPLETDWTNKVHKNPAEWMSWINERYNIGVRTGKVSNLTVIDIDQDVVPKELNDLLNTTLSQKTNKGFHFFYQYEPSLPVTRIESLKTDILNDGRQVVIPPSVVGDKVRFFVDDRVKIAKMSDKLKEYLTSITKDKKLENPLSLETGNIEEGDRNNTLVHLGGIIRQWCNPEQTAKTMWLINTRFMNPPLHRREVEAMARSIDKYSQSDFSKLEDRVYSYLQIVENANIHDIKDFTKEARDKIDIAVYNLVSAEKIIRHGNRYSVLKKVSWRDDFNVATGERVNFEVPYFNDAGNFCWGDMVLIGGKPSVGKTTVAMNIVRQLSLQGKIPYYVNLESGSRFGRTAERLGIRQGQMKWTTTSNPMNIEIEKGVITIIDWLMIEDKCQTDSVFKHFAEQLQSKGGFLFLFQQLRENNTYFAPDLVKQFPSFACRYIYDDETKDRLNGHFKIDKNREPKDIWVNKIPCKYDTDTMLLEEVTNIGAYGVDKSEPKEAQTINDIKEVFGGTLI